MLDMEIYKAAGPEDIRRCLEIRNKVFIVEKGVPEEVEVDGYDCLNNSCEHFLIRHEGKAAGTIRCLHMTENTIRIQRFCFLKEFRGLGLGRAVLNYIEGHYRKEHIVKVEMDAKYDVFRFYEKCGYEKISDVFIEAGIEHVKMIKEI